MTPMLYFDTAAGRFEVAQDDAHRFHVLYAGESLTDAGNLADAIESFVHESGFSIMHPEMGDPLDAFDLGIPDELEGWKRY